MPRAADPSRRAGPARRRHRSPDPGPAQGRRRHRWPGRRRRSPAPHPPPAPTRRSRSVSGPGRPALAAAARPVGAGPVDGAPAPGSARAPADGRRPATGGPARPPPVPSRRRSAPAARRPAVGRRRHRPPPRTARPAGAAPPPAQRRRPDRTRPRSTPTPGTAGPCARWLGRGPPSGPHRACPLITGDRPRPAAADVAGSTGGWARVGASRRRLAGSPTVGHAGQLPLAVAGVPVPVSAVGAGRRRLLHPGQPAGPGRRHGRRRPGQPAGSHLVPRSRSWSSAPCCSGRWRGAAFPELRGTGH